MEGAPGIGKTTLSWELCRKWDKFDSTQHYSSVLLLRLREKQVQEMKEVSHLLSAYKSQGKETIAQEVTKIQGRGVLFVLDGFDELPKPLQQEGLLVDLIQGSVLPESTVLVTSRPLATGQLLASCRPRIDKHVEILGFTQESVEDYAASIFTQQEELASFKHYISASQNPAINSLMYVPLNAAIIAEIFRNSKSDTLLPHTLTELYTQLCLTILNRHLNKTHLPSPMVDKFEDLPSDLHQQFLCLCEVAFQAVKEDRLVLQSLPPNLLTFGFLNVVPALYGGGGVSYNFIHLTVQEFFAAYHIAHLGSRGLEVFTVYGKVQRWNVVWRFVAGLTKFREYAGHLDRSAFHETNPHYMQFSLFLFQCLFEAQTKKYFSSVYQDLPARVAVKALNPTSLDAYALGYCIANFHIRAPWDIKIEGAGHHSFTCGLNTKNHSHVKIISLTISDCQIDLSDLESNPLSAIEGLWLTYCQLTNTELIRLSHLIPDLPFLKAINILGNRVTDGEQDGLMKFLYQVAFTNVTDLNIGRTGLRQLLESPHDYSSALKHLIHPSSGKLLDLGVGSFSDVNDDKLADILVSAPSSLKIFMLYFNNLSPYALHLQNSTCLMVLKLTSEKLPAAVPDLVAIVSHNNTLQVLRLYMFRNGRSDIPVVRPLVTAIRGNSTLRRIIINIDGIGESNEAVSRYMISHHQDLTVDERIVWKYTW